MTAVDNLRRPVDRHVPSHTPITYLYPHGHTRRPIVIRLPETVTRARAFLTLRKAFNASGGGKPNNGRKKRSAHLPPSAPGATIPGGEPAAPPVRAFGSPDRPPSGTAPPTAYGIGSPFIFIQQGRGSRNGPESVFDALT